MKNIRILILEISSGISGMFKETLQDDPVELVILNSTARLEEEIEKGSCFDLCLLESTLLDGEDILYAAILKLMYGDNKIYIVTDNEINKKRFSAAGYQCCGKDQIIGVISAMKVAV